MSALVKYDAACRAVAEAKSVDEVKDIHDKAEGMRAYARQAKNRQLEIDAAEIRMRAERRLGVLMQAQRETVGLAQGKRTDLGPISTQVERPTLAEAGIDKHLADRARKMAAVPEDKFEGMLGEWRERVQAENERVTTSLLRAGTEAENDTTRAQAVTVPDGKYRCLVVDPPWPMQKIARDVAPNQAGFDYPTMSEDELLAYSLPSEKADEAAHIWLWTTQKFLPLALRLTESWGFDYLCTFVWHKAGGFQPFGLPQYNCEFVIMGRRGGLSFLELKDFKTCFEAPRREHSRKPDQFYDLVQRVSPGPRLDMFSREVRAGFDQHGLETGKFAA